MKLAKFSVKKANVKYKKCQDNAGAVCNGVVKY